MTRIVVVGARGRMGQAILGLARNNPEFEVVDEVDVGDAIAAQFPACDTIIDFTHHTASEEIATLAARAGKALVIGTTGHTTAEREAVLRCAERIPLILSPNFSVGVNALFYLTRRAAEILGEGFDREVVEMHHRLKKDAPSGTARRLAEILAEQLGGTYEDLGRHGRAGDTGERTGREIGIHALRGGDVVGDHTVVFAGAGERIELTHKASSRDTFASGALRAAAWLKGRAPGSYSMFDVLGLA
ncbi:MAG: 4-hydroxy-tetrahydrodipicolinate reductase [Candidatus Methylacidiphilales bacterium]